MKRLLIVEQKKGRNQSFSKFRYRSVVCQDTLTVVSRADVLLWFGVVFVVFVVLIVIVIRFWDHPNQRKLVRG